VVVSTTAMVVAAASTMVSFVYVMISIGINQ
jgi:hypothetical protein